MNSTEKKALVELSKSLEDVQMWTRSLKDIADNLIERGQKDDDVSKILADNHCEQQTLRWLMDSVKDVQMLMRILR